MTDNKLDLRGTPCPLNFIRSKLQLEKMPSGQLLEIWLDGGEPVEQVPNSLKMEGYEIQSITPLDDYFALLVKS
ncbi:hypothetical protein Cyast_0182 [Cyanobacterium stanieri PCC 7202]|uniref:UPF0033 domain-containing protein n=1 Tax=Cyanobacterium stanieri (strain ATCC 29140 / PCC 7202) TaxID=292563 RepID=K9YID2_CYASC|nr:hypothetical protein Cyast_0182 [Cyanobacterium stanieri PCC 7202]